MPPKDRHDVNIAIAGGGFSGLGMAIALRREGIQDFVVLERADDLGGTWRDNTYPGCACDIASVLYSYSDEQNPGWTQAFAGQPEIWACIREVARRHDVASHMRYGHELLSAVWDDETDLWELETSQGDFTAEILLSATGALADPAIPDLPGLGRFGGTVFHSARWDHDHDLAGRRVAVVGTGASAIQFVPEIQPQVGHLDLFQRTPRGCSRVAIRRSRRPGVAASPAIPSCCREMAFAAEVAEWAPAPLGMVFNNAGVATSQSIADGSVEDDEWVEEINFGGVVNGVRAFLPILLRQNSGVIVNTSSVFGLVGIPYQSAYCASKVAVRGFTESLRHELRGTGVRAVTVHPGGVKTNIARNARYHAHPPHRDVSHDEASRQFDAMARTTPVRAAKIIHEGVVAGRSRILVGPDAYLFDVLARLAPTRYFDVLALLEPLAVRLN
jgi:NAD(P)-dependent dehydrogenase (short-subunit alcohol dehydrogenase family)